MIEKTINYFDDRVRVVCDAQCNKAWGTNSRPKIEFDEDDPDDYVWLSDGELGEAPADPGTYEGDQAKPTAYDNPEDHLLNKWCVRECERSGMMGGRHGDYPPHDFTKRVYNMPSRHPHAEFLDHHAETLEKLKTGDMSGTTDLTGLSDEDLAKALFK